MKVVAENVAKVYLIGVCITAAALALFRATPVFDALAAGALWPTFVAELLIAPLR